MLLNHLGIPNVPVGRLWVYDGRRAHWLAVVFWGTRAFLGVDAKRLRRIMMVWELLQLWLSGIHLK